MTDRAMENWLNLQSKKAKKCLTVKTREEIGPLYRIDKVVPKAFIARMPTAAMTKEDDSVPRICTAASIIECLVGYALGRVEYDYVDGHIDEKDWMYKGGYVISEIPYELCVIPSKELLPDVEKTGEVWIVNHTSAHTNIKPVQIGKLFLSKLSYLHNDPKQSKPDTVFDFYIETDRELQLTPEKKIDAGKYQFTYAPSLSKKENGEYDENGLTGVITVTEKEFNQAKLRTAAMLSLQEPIPFSLNWKK